MKYTHKSLCVDLLALNAKLEKAGRDDRRLRDALAGILIAGGANGADVPALLKIASDALTTSTTEGGAA